MPRLVKQSNSTARKRKLNGERKDLHVCLLTTYKLGVKERAQVKLPYKNIGQTKMNRVQYPFDLVFYEIEDRYAGKDGIRASPAGELSQH